MPDTDFSIIIPVYNEERSLAFLHKELTEYLDIEWKKFKYEVIYIDDGSRDQSYRVLREISNDPKVTVLKFLSNYGKSAALQAGFDIAKGNIFITIDSDLQHIPSDIPRLLKKLRGYHMVCGWRVKGNASGSFIGRRIPSKITNRIVNNFTNLKLNDITGGMRVFRREVADHVRIFGNMHRYMPILAAWKGFRITEHPITLRKRKFGKSKFSSKRLFRGGVDLLTIKFYTTYSKRPLHVFFLLALPLLLVGSGAIAFLILRKLFFGTGIFANQVMFLLSILLIILGINFISSGFIADLIAFDASKKDDSFIVERKIIKNKEE